MLDEGLTVEQMRWKALRLRYAQISQQLYDMQGQLIEVETRLQHLEREEQPSTYDVIVKKGQSRCWSPRSG